MNATTSSHNTIARHSTLSRRGFGALSGALLLIGFFMQSVKVAALGFLIPNQDAEATARGNAFTATADTPAAIFYNPAGITQIEGTSAQFGLHTIGINSFYSSKPPAPASHAESEFSLQPVPQFYATHQLKDTPFTLGIGMYAPYGLAIEWPDGSTFRNSSDYYGKLVYLTINPVGAWKINDQLSLAAGPTINYSQVLLRSGLGAPGTQFKFRGDGYAFGGTAGLLWKPAEKWAFGLRYHSPTSINFEGSTSANLGGGPNGSMGSASSADVPFPQFVMAGISYRPNPKWNIEADVNWADWHVFKTVTFNNVPANVGGGNLTKNFNWHSSVLLELGATRYLDNGYFVSAGYFFSQKSTTDYHFTPVVPDTDLHVASLGFGHKGERWDWALSGQLITAQPRTVSGDQNPVNDGAYQWVNGAVNLSFNYHFR